MKHFIEGVSRLQSTLFPGQFDDHISEDNPVRVIDVYVGEMDLLKVGFEIIPAQTGRPSYHPEKMLKIYIYGYLNHVQSSRRLEHET
jgi:transposase